MTTQFDLIWKNLSIGLKEYCEKNGFKKVLLGLSGGMDSAFVFALACHTLGAENVTAIMMKTKHTSQLSLDITRDLTKHYHAPYQEIDIQPYVDNMIHLLKTTLSEPIKPIVTENIQARIRGQILMAISNQTGALVLACGNKSEACVGYCTLYGDTCGGLMPIGNIYKSTLYQLADYIGQKHGVYLTPEVISRMPSAELAENQKDADSLPPYPILDAILTKLVNLKQTPKQIIQMGFDKQTVDRISALYQKSAFKRLQLPPTLNI